jgi:hypothetical protein
VYCESERNCVKYKYSVRLYIGLKQVKYNNFWHQFAILPRTYMGNQIKEYEIGEICNPHREMTSCLQVWSEILKRKIPLGRRQRKWKGNGTYLNDLGCEDVDWIHLAQVVSSLLYSLSYWQRRLMNNKKGGILQGLLSTLNFRVTWKKGNLFLSWATISISRRTLWSYVATI